MPDMEHPDEAQDQQMIAPLVQAVEYLIQEVSVLKGQLADLSSLVMDDLIGGMHSVYSDNKKATAIGGLKSKFGDRLNPHFDLLKEFTPDLDHWDELHKLTDGKSDDEIQSMIDQLDSVLGEKFGKIRGGAPAAAKITSVEATPLPENTEPETEEDSGPVDEAVNIASKLSDKALKRR